MRKKRLDLCSEPFCRRPTWTGKPEPDPRMRHCVYHSPEARLRAARLPRPPKKHPEPKKPRGMRLPLTCVFRPFEVVDQGRRTVYVGCLCGAKAPRRPNLEPRYPNRFGEPLCEDHASYARSRHAFPD